MFVTKRPMKATVCIVAVLVVSLLLCAIFFIDAVGAHGIADEQDDQRVVDKVLLSSSSTNSTMSCSFCNQSRPATKTVKYYDTYLYDEHYHRYGSQWQLMSSTYVGYGGPLTVTTWVPIGNCPNSDCGG